MNRNLYKDLDNLYEGIESLNNKIKRQERELELTYKGIEQLNNVIHKAIEYIEKQTKEGIIKDKRYFYSPEQANDLLKILKGEDKE